MKDLVRVRSWNEVVEKVNVDCNESRKEFWASWAGEPKVRNATLRNEVGVSTSTKDS